MKLINYKEYKNKSGIYKITCIINNKIYIGQSSNLYSRFQKYKNKSNNNTPIYRAINKYGIENFEFEILEICNINILNLKEQYYIDKYLPFNPIGYNIRTIAESNRGYKMSQESKDKLSNTKKNNTYNFGKHLSKEHRKAISDGNKGRIVSEETRRKLSISKLRNTPGNKGKKCPHSLERIEAIRKGVQERWRIKKELDKQTEINIENITL